MSRHHTMTLAGLGERGILEVLHRRFDTVPAAGRWPKGTLGPGDDAAVVPAPDGRFVISVDAMAQDRDFKLTWPSGAVDSGYSTGWKAAAQNLSDINAMGARPTSVLLALTLPETTPVTWLDGLAAGIAGAIRHLGARDCRIAGGDLGSDDRITIALTVTGDLDGFPAVRRTLDPAVRERWDAQEHGAGALVLGLCGRAGWAAAGLQVLLTPRDQLLEALNRTGTARLAAQAAAAQLRPRPVLTAGPTAAAAGALAMMDVSDGLLRDAGRLGTANALAPVLDEAWVAQAAAPLKPLAHALDADARHWVRAGGEDYGLLAVFDPHTPLPAGFSAVGNLVVSEQRATTMPQGGGWDHFGG